MAWKLAQQAYCGYAYYAWLYFLWIQYTYLLGRRRWQCNSKITVAILTVAVFTMAILTRAILAQATYYPLVTTEYVSQGRR